MSKKQKKQTKKNSAVGMSIALVIVTIIAIVVVMLLIFRQPSDSENKNKQTDIEGESSVNQTIEEDKGLEFPYQLEKGRLEIASVFKFTGMNPDCGDQDGENIAAIQVTNQSEQHLASAEVKVRTTSGNELVFRITDLPAGQSVTAFEVNNDTYELSEECVSMEAVAEFEATTPLMEETMVIDVQEMTITLTNKSDKTLSNLVLHCHCMIDDAYFGGLTYTYPVESISAGETIILEAIDCYLGEAAVVRVNQGD